MKICVFCSANSNIEPVYFDAAAQLGSWMGKESHDLVFGGCDMGLMKAAADAVRSAGGRCIGVVPSIIEKGGRKYPDLDVDIPCDNLSDRKDLMLQYSDVSVALPGGIGTLDEIFTVASAATIGYHSKKVIVLNVGGFFNPLKSLLDSLQHKGFIRGDYHEFIDFADDMDSLILKLGNI